MRILYALTLAALTAACATPAERAAQKQREVDYMIQVYGPACERLGYKSNTDPWRDCVLRLSSKDDAAFYGRSLVTTGCYWPGGAYQCM